jgi:hypothetical protein
MGQNLGIENEHNILQTLQGKRDEELPAALKHMVNRLFGNGQSSPIFVSKLNMEQKADFTIQMGQVKKYVSIKSGDYLTFHSEPIETWIGFLRTLGVSSSTLKTLLFFQYGDRTLNGTGTMRYRAEAMRHDHQVHFDRASKELSQPHLMVPIIERAILKGRFADNHPIDAIYHGDENEGKTVLSHEIQAILLAKKYQRKNGTINLTRLTFQPKVRNLFYYPNAEAFRHVSVIKWRSFRQDILLYQRKFFK